MKNNSTAASESLNFLEEFIDEQFLDVIRGDTHIILSDVYRTLGDLGCKDLPVVEEKFQIIESRLVNLIEQVKFLQNKFGET